MDYATNLHSYTILDCIKRFKRSVGNTKIIIANESLNLHEEERTLFLSWSINHIFSFFLYPLQIYQIIILKIMPIFYTRRENSVCDNIVHRPY